MKIKHYSLDLYVSAYVQTLRVTPAMEAGIADHVWSIEEMLSLAVQKKQAA
jgi:hypothetical protein